MSCHFRRWTANQNSIGDVGLSFLQVVFVGDSSSGKSSIITRFMHDYFEPNYQATIGIDFLSKIMHLDDGRKVRLQLWDTAGQERFRSLIPSYIRDAAAAVVVYDISNHESFENTTRWVQDIMTEREGAKVVLCLVGNKTDLGNSLRCVTQEEAEERAKQHDMIFMECSAKAGYNVNELFTKMANALPVQPQPATKESNTYRWGASSQGNNGATSGSSMSNNSNNNAGGSTVKLQPQSLSESAAQQAKSCGC